MATTSVRPPSAEVVGRQFVRDPDSWLLFVAATVAFLSAVQLFVYPFGRSLSEYAIDGREIVLGGAPAKTYWSLRAPGIALLHAAIQRLIAPSAMAARSVEVLVLFGLSYLAIRLCRRFVELERVGWIGGAVALFVHAQLEFEHTGQPELYATLLVLGATLVTVRKRPRRGRHWQFAAVGALASMAIVFIPLFGLALLPLLVWIWRDECQLRLNRWAPLGAVLTTLAATLIGPLLLVAWLYRKGALRVFTADWLFPSLHLWSSWAPDGFLEWLYFTADRLLLRQSAIVPAGILLAFVLTPLTSEERRGMRLLLWIATAELFAFALSFESNPGRLSGALPILGIIAGVGIYKAYRRMLTQGPFAVVAFASGLTLLGGLCTAVDVAPGTYFHRSWVRLKYIAGFLPYRAPELLESELYSNTQFNLAASRRVAALLNRQRPVDREVLVQGDEPQVLWLAQLRPLARLTRPIPEDIAEADPSLDERLSRDIEGKKPRLVVISPAASVIRQPSFARRLGYDREFLLANYEVSAARDGWAIRIPRP